MTDVEQHPFATMKGNNAAARKVTQRSKIHSVFLSENPNGLQPPTDGYETFRRFREAQMTRHSGSCSIHIVCLVAAIATFIGFCRPSYAAEDWLPISQDELKMTSEPKALGAPAIYLYRQIDRDDVNSHLAVYERIKILSEEGRKYADVEISFLKGRDNIKDIQARTIQTDGSIVNLTVKPYETTIVKAKGVKYLAKTFTMPDVHVGSIIEYRYTNNTNPYWLYDSYWLLSADLFTKYAKFSLRRSPSFALRWSWPNGLPGGSQPPKEDHGIVRLEAQNIAAFQFEDYMPPERELKMRIDFVYESWNKESEPAKYWEKFGKAQFEANEKFLDKRKVMEQALVTIVQPSDDPQTKLQKIYARVQQLRNYSFEREKSWQEQEREKRHDINNIEDVWKQQGGNGSAINLLFVGLVRAAGMDVSFVEVSTRDSYFFTPLMMSSSQLNNNVVLVRLAGKDLYFDPGTTHLPFGLLPWHETGVKGFIAAKQGGTWTETPRPDSDISRIERKADLRLAEDGVLEGKVTVAFTGLEAFGIRMDAEDKDDSARKKMLEDSVRESLPVESQVTLTNQPEWSGSSPSFTAEFTIKIEGWVTNAGRRQLFPAGLFGADEKHLFENNNRVHPIYLQFPSLKTDDVVVALPSGWQIESLPPPAYQDHGLVAFKTNLVNDRGSLHISRTLRINFLLLDTSYYHALRDFFQNVRSGDEQQVLLRPAS
jgi:hypothetical protein